MNSNVFLKPEEGKFLALATIQLIEDLRETSKNVKINWNPEARKQLKEMLEAGNSLHIKLSKLGFDMSELPPFEEGDQNEFITKQS